MRTNRKTTRNRKIYRPEDLQFVDDQDFRNHVVAQDDDCDYSESGWVAVVKGRYAALATYGHCSCYGTWTAIHKGGVRTTGGTTVVWDWIGPVQGLIRLAKTNGDPHMKGRTANPEDCDYHHLQEVYRQVLEWDRKRKL